MAILSFTYCISAKVTPPSSHLRSDSIRGQVSPQRGHSIRHLLVKPSPGHLLKPPISYRHLVTPDWIYNLLIYHDLSNPCRWSSLLHHNHWPILSFSDVKLQNNCWVWDRLPRRLPVECWQRWKARVFNTTLSEGGWDKSKWNGPFTMYIALHEQSFWKVCLTHRISYRIYNCHLKLNTLGLSTISGWSWIVFNSPQLTSTHHETTERPCSSPAGMSWARLWRLSWEVHKVKKKRHSNPDNKAN